MERLETNRLILRLWQADDLNDLYEYASVEGVGEMAGWPHHKSLSDTKLILDKFIQEKNNYAIVHKQHNKVIGSLRIHDRIIVNGFGNNQKELGYVLSKEYWNQGLMTEAVRTVIKYCFQKLHIDTLWCGHFNFNLKSKRVIEKSGFIFYEEYKVNLEQLNKSYQGMRYYLTKEDYFKNNQT